MVVFGGEGASGVVGQFELEAPIAFVKPGQDCRTQPKQGTDNGSDDEGYYDLANDDTDNQANDCADCPATPDRRRATALFTHGGESIARGVLTFKGRKVLTISGAMTS